MYHSIRQIQQQLSRKKTTATEIARCYLTHINKNAKLNAFVEVFEKETLQQAAQLDKKLVNKEAGKLHGLFIAIKDNICYKDHSSTAGSAILKDFVSVYHSTVVKRLLEEDAIIIGRTNCDEFGMGGSNENSVYGPVLNPLDNSKVPGGSSGGSAAAVAADCCLAALGSDTGGSVRQPAAFCGLVGLKPTYGRISRYGLIAYGSSLDHIGIIAKNSEDTALILEVIAGKDEHDSTASDKKVPSYSRFSITNKSPKIGYFPTLHENHMLDKEIAGKVREKISELLTQGLIVDPLDFPFMDQIIPVYYTIVSAECASNLARYDGIHYGKRSPKSSNYYAMISHTRAEGFGDEVKRKVLMGNYILSTNHEKHYFDKAVNIRKAITHKFDALLNSYDFLIMPATPTTAFNLSADKKVRVKHENQFLSGEDMLNLLHQDIFLFPANLAGFPSISVPLGKHSNGMPIGVQVCGKKFSEKKLLAFVKGYFNSSS